MHVIFAESPAPRRSTTPVAALSGGPGEHGNALDVKPAEDEEGTDEQKQYIEKCMVSAEDEAFLCYEGCEI